MTRLILALALLWLLTNTMLLWLDALLSWLGGLHPAAWFALLCVGVFVGAAVGTAIHDWWYDNT
jgi:hypothetical protein